MRRSAKNRSAFRVSALFRMPKIWTSMGRESKPAGQGRATAPGGLPRQAAGALVHHILAEPHLAVPAAVGGQGAERLEAALGGGLIGGGDHAAVARLDHAEAERADPEGAHAVLAEGCTARDHQVGPEPVHRQRRGHPAVEIGQRLLGDQQERERRRRSSPGVPAGA